jgi:hypothetical protein
MLSAECSFDLTGERKEGSNSLGEKGKKDMVPEALL